MPNIRPFRGLRYAPDIPLERVVAPPYDVIDPTLHVRLAAIPDNAVHLILSEPGEAGDRYAQAAATLGRWRGDGTLRLEEAPAFYVYAQTFAFLGGEALTRAGVVGAVAHGPDIWGHERTHQGPKDDRLRLLTATDTNLSPIFGLVDDPQGELEDAVEDVMTTPAAADFTDAQDVRHRLWVVTDAPTCERIHAAMRETNVVIADGPHRYETSVTYRDTVDGPGSDAVMMMCVSLRSRGLRIYPYHRVLALTPGGDEAGLDATLAGWEVERIPGGADVWPQVEARLAELQPGHHAFALHTPGFFRVVHVPRDVHARGVDGLDVTVLQRDLLEQAWGLDVEEVMHAGDLWYTPDAGEACVQVHDGTAQCAVLVNPTPTDAVVACARAGQRMPQKSTYFYPKLLTGLVFRPLAEDPGGD